MADHTRNALRAAVRAMNDVVIPAIDPRDPLAVEQAKIVARLLDLVEQRIDLSHERARFEASHYLDVAMAIRDDTAVYSPMLAAVIDDETAAVGAILADPSASTVTVRDAATMLAELVSASVRAGRNAPAGRRTEHAVLSAAGELLTAQRAWFLPQGWESDPSIIPTPEVAFATPASHI
jgi:hypothetical protein